jgi:hypothetical protein
MGVRGLGEPRRGVARVRNIWAAGRRGARGGTRFRHGCTGHLGRAAPTTGIRGTPVHESSSHWACGRWADRAIRNLGTLGLYPRVGPVTLAVQA